MALEIERVIASCLQKDGDIDSSGGWDRSFYDEATDSSYKIRAYEPRFDYRAILKELDGTGYWLKAIIDLDMCFPHYKKQRYHLYVLSKSPADIVIITYKGDWNKTIKQIRTKPEFNTFALTKSQAIYLHDVVDVWLNDGTLVTDNPLCKVEIVTDTVSAKSEFKDDNGPIGISITPSLKTGMMAKTSSSTMRMKRSPTTLVVKPIHTAMNPLRDMPTWMQTKL